MKREAVMGAAWTVIDKAGSQVISFLAFVTLARLLLPQDYGLVTLATTIVAIPTVFLTEGFAPALIQYENLTDDHINVVFWTNLVLSIILTAITMAIAGWVGVLAHSPALPPILRATALIMPPQTVGAVWASIFMRRLQYNTFALRTAIAQTSCAVIAVAMALCGFGVWSLVGQQLSFYAISLAVLSVGLGWRPHLSFSMSALRDLFRFSTTTMLGGMLRFAYYRVDTLLIGLFLSPAALGLYSMTKRLLQIIADTQIPITAIMMPVLSRMQNERERLGNAYVRMLWMGACLWVPAVIGIGVIAERLLPLLFGKKWEESAIVMMVMSGTAFSFSITGLTRELLLSINRPGVYSQLNAVQLGLTTALILIGVPFGLVPAAMGYVMASLLVIPFHLHALNRYAQISPRVVMARLLPVFCAGSTMAAAIYAVGMLLPWGNWTLLPQVVTGLAVYPLCLYCYAPTHTREAVQTIYQSLPPRFRVFRFST
jgi:O-antigen/teichoic acid export membrane protein